MGKMKEVAMIMRDGETGTLQYMRDMAKKHGRSGVFFRGRKLTFEEADNILNLIHHEQNKIRGDQQSSQ